jgi:small multidrug resistance pump
VTALPYLYLGCAIVLEVIGTSALKMSDSFTKLTPSIVSLVTYGAALALLAIVLRTIPVGIAYAI